MENWSICLQIDEPKTQWKTMVAVWYLFREVIFSPISSILLLEFEYCSGDDLVIIKSSRVCNRGRIFSIGCVLPEKYGPTMSVLFWGNKSDQRCWHFAPRTTNFWISLKFFLVVFILEVFASSSIFEVVTFI